MNFHGNILLKPFKEDLINAPPSEYENGFRLLYHEKHKKLKRALSKFSEYPAISSTTQIFTQTDIK